MAGACLVLVLLVELSAVQGQTEPPETFALELSIPYTLNSNQQHLCTAVKVDSRSEGYMVTFEPHVHPDHVRHLSLQLCDVIPKDAMKTTVWPCQVVRVVCGGRVQPVYVWGQNSSGWILPPDVSVIDTGIPLGGPQGQAYLLMQVHLKGTASDVEDTRTPDQRISNPEIQEPVTETASLIVNTTTIRPLLELGLAILQNIGFIPKGNKVATTESACQWQSEQPAVIAGFRLHTHSRGVWMEALLEHRGHWLTVVEDDPSLPEDILPANGTVIMRRGDFLVARCYFRQDPERDVPFGSSWKEEMCNLHILYFLPTDAAPNLRFQLCTNQVPSIALRHLFPDLPSPRTFSN